MTYEVQQNGDTTTFLLKMPSNLSGDDCINLNMEILLPYSANLVRVAIHNADVLVYPFIKAVDTVHIQTSNGKIELDRWSGESIKLITSNGDLSVGSLMSGGSIYIENSNGGIYLSENIEAKKTVDVRNSNGLVEALGTITADDSINVQSSNQVVQLGSLFADNIFVENSNSPVQVEHVEAKVQVTVKSSNAPIDLNVAGEKNNRVMVLTSGSPVNLHMVR
jgi:hypothetical protein